MKMELSSLQKKIIISTIIWGVLAHFFLFTNVLIEFDAAYFINNVGGTIELGRWGLYILKNVMDTLFYGTYNTPWLIGCVSVSCFIVVNLLLVSLFDIKDELMAIIVSGVMILNPATLGIFYFAYTAPYYFISLILAVLSVWILNKNIDKWIYIVIAGVIIAFSMGIYQAMVTVTAMIMLFILLGNLLWKKDIKPKDIFCQGVKYAVTLGFGGGLYLVINKIVIHITNTVTSSYRGMDTIKYTDFLKINYKELVKVLLDINDPLYYFKVFVEKTSIIYQLSVLTIILISICVVMVCFKNRDFLRGILILIILFLMPIAANPFAIVDLGMVTTLMQISRCLFFIFFIVMIKNICQNMKCSWMKNTLVYLSFAMILYTNIYYVYYDNRCYSEAELRKMESISWMTTLIAQIKDLEGFDENMNIAYIQNGEMQDHTFISDKSMVSLDERLYYGDIRKHYSWKQYMKIWCGFEMTEVSSEVMEKIKADHIVEEMPVYPNDGSIQIVDGTIVVKFNEF